MKLVKQGHNGCGVACVAMVANENYSTVKKIIEPFRNLKFQGTRTQDLVYMLNYLDIKTKSRRLIPLKENYRKLNCPAILKVNPRYNGWHWVVWDNKRKKILDPHPGAYRRYRAVSYLGIKSS